MIETLRVRDFALVDELCLDFSPGFTVLTGETGAGKSILLQALGLLLGERASREAVRAGADQARVEGVFAPSGAVHGALAAALDEAGVPWPEGEPLLVSRTVGADGRSRAQVNGALVPLAVLERVGARLVEVSSQHQHQGLMREETHLSLLDAALGPEGRSVLEAYRTTYEAWERAEAEARRVEGLEATARERQEFLRFQAEEIRQARLEPGEEERLAVEREVLLHAGKLLEAYAAAEAEVYSGGDAALDRLGRAAKAVEAASRKDPEAAGILELLAEARASLDEAALRLRDRQQGLEADPRRLEAVEERLETVRRLERKHGTSTAAILQRLSAIEAELGELDHRELALEAARKRRDAGRLELDAAAERLGAARRQAGRELESRIGVELEALALGRSSFRVELTSGEPGPRGTDAARFLLAPNPGEAPRPLARIASGGELSRILLALKNALRDASVETLVFDEVDAGIGGTVADAVGDRLAALAGACQVVCITHLPQIACRATHHWSVEKQEAGGRTVTRVRALGPEDRVDELARMLGGRHVTGKTLEHARELAERFAP
ncbi:MAG: DNA repair protein RecN [Deltaproteobacteria bacterium]|nr:DNA repair protein RecN [Deltaproteobacteria bacterium]